MSKFVKRKWIKVNYLLNGQYSLKKNARFNIPMLRSNDDMTQKDVAFKNNASFRSCITKN